MSVKYATNEDLNYAAQVQKNMFVQKEAGKSLVSDTEIEKLAQMTTDGEENIIETIKVNGVAAPVTNKSVEINFQTEEQIDEKISAAVSNVYKVKGSIAFANLPTTGNAAGDVYNVTDAFTTTIAFVEGAGIEYPAGTNVVWTEAGKWDAMAGTYDFSGFMLKSEIVPITEEEIDAMYNS